MRRSQNEHNRDIMPHFYGDLMVVIDGYYPHSQTALLTSIFWLFFFHCIKEVCIVFALSRLLSTSLYLRLRSNLTLEMAD